MDTNKNRETHTFPLPSPTGTPGRAEERGKKREERGEQGFSVYTVA
jgi:hypothetical protein